MFVYIWMENLKNKDKENEEKRKAYEENQIN
jgi:hypothetical protein